MGELPRKFAQPANMYQSISVMFFVDLSKSMSKRDITGRQGSRRIDAVVEVLKRFIAQQIALGAVLDLYSLVTFSGSEHKAQAERC